MFSKLVTVVLVVESVFGEIRRNDVDPRYFIGPFNGGEFPIAIDKCLPFTVVGENFQRATCLSETEVLWRQYDDEACEGTILLELATNTSTQNSMGSYFDFNCNEDSPDDYASVDFSVGTCDTESIVTMDAALDVCTANTGTLGGDLTQVATAESIRVFCNSEIAELQYFDSAGEFTGVCDDNGDDSNFLYVRNATTDCGYMLSVTNSLGTTHVFGKLVQCTVDPVQDDSASILSMFCLIIITLISTLFM